LAGSPYLGGLRVLDLRDNRVGVAGAEALLASRALAGLRVLGLSNNLLGFEREDQFDWDGTVVAQINHKAENFERWARKARPRLI
jgi:hypothetical protein